METSKKPEKEKAKFPYTCSFVSGTLLELVECTKKLDLKKIGNRSGDVVVITGGARGIGAEVVKRLLKCDFHVVMGLRSPLAGENLVQNFRNDGIHTGKATYLPLDLKSLASVREFGNLVLQTFPKIHILICNAGIMGVPYEITEDGFESHFQVNYLSHFLLTKILMARIIESTSNSPHAGRIVNVSSSANWAGNIKDISYIETRHKKYNKFKAYCDTKLCQVTSSNHLEGLLRQQSTNVYAYSLHPGVILTEISAEFPPPKYISGMLRTTDDGADGIVCAAASPKFEKRGGIFLNNCKVDRPNRQARSKKIQTNLWNKSCALLGIEREI